MSETTVKDVTIYINPSKTFQSVKKTDVFKEMIDEVKAETSFNLDSEELFNAIQEREALSTTGFGNGFAIPHGKTSQLHNPMVVLMRTDQDIEWEAMDDAPVSIIFLLIVPAEHGETIHLKLLSKLSYHLMDKEIQAQFKAAKTQSELKDLLNQILV